MSKAKYIIPRKKRLVDVDILKEKINWLGRKKVLIAWKKVFTNDDGQKVYEVSVACWVDEDDLIY